MEEWKLDWESTELDFKEEIQMLLAELGGVALRDILIVRENIEFKRIYIYLFF